MGTVEQLRAMRDATRLVGIVLRCLHDPAFRVELEQSGATFADAVEKARNWTPQDDCGCGGGCGGC